VKYNILQKKKYNDIKAWIMNILIKDSLSGN
jgi:hypothetical protein